MFLVIYAFFPSGPFIIGLRMLFEFKSIDNMKFKVILLFSIMATCIVQFHL
jgi:hypothetical protein